MGDDLRVIGGVETLTVRGAAPGTRLRVMTSTGDALVTLVADDAGNAHVVFVPPEHRIIAEPSDLVDALSSGYALAPGKYTVVEEPVDGSAPISHGPVSVLAVDDHPDPNLYDQEIGEGYGYLTVRDGVTLSVMVRFPNEDLYGPAPWPPSSSTPVMTRRTRMRRSRDPCSPICWVSRRWA